MKRMIPFFIAGALALVGTSAWSAATPDGEKFWPSLASGLVVFSGAVGTLILRRAREKETRSAAEFSVEKDMAIKAQSSAFGDALILGALLLASITIFELHQFAAPLLVAYLLLLVLDFFIRFRFLVRT